MHKGVVLSFHGTWGCIEPSTSARAEMSMNGMAKNAKLYVHFQGIRKSRPNEFRSLNEGDSVAFILKESHNGKGLMASDVTVDPKDGAATTNGPLRRQLVGAKRSVHVAASVAKANGKQDDAMTALLDALANMGAGLEMVANRVMELSAQDSKKSVVLTGWGGKKTKEEVRECITSLLDKLLVENEVPCGPGNRSIHMKNNMGTIAFTDEDAAASFKANWVQEYGKEAKVSYFNAGKWRRALSDVLEGKRGPAPKKGWDMPSEGDDFIQVEGRHACRTQEASTSEVNRMKYLVDNPTLSQAASRPNANASTHRPSASKGAEGGKAKSDQGKPKANAPQLQLGKPTTRTSMPSEKRKKNESPKASPPATTMSGRGRIGASPVNTGGVKQGSSSSSGSVTNRGPVVGGLVRKLSLTAPSLAPINEHDDMDLDAKNRKRMAEEGMASDSAPPIVKRVSIQSNHKSTQSDPGPVHTDPVLIVHESSMQAPGNDENQRMNMNSIKGSDVVVSSDGGEGGAVRGGGGVA